MERISVFYDKDAVYCREMAHNALRRGNVYVAADWLHMAASSHLLADKYRQEGD